MSRTLAICLIVVTVIMQMKENVNAAIQLTATPYLQTFVSHDTYDGITYYPEGNYSRDWLITGYVPNNVITIEILKCVLETGNNKGICIDDNIFIYDGVNASAPLLKQTCCGIGDVDVNISLHSTDSPLYVVFQTDDTVSNEGFRISYILEGAPTKCSEVTTNNVNGAIHLTATPYLQTFVSHDTYDGITYYPEGNYSRDWLITGQNLNYPITIEFLKCVLETGNDHGICTWDNIFIYDGANASAPLLKQTCCGIGDNGPFSLQSTCGYMYVVFQTDNTISREGFRISYILEGASTTAAPVTTVDREHGKSTCICIYLDTCTFRNLLYVCCFVSIAS